MLLLLGACRHDNLPPPADRDLQERWSGAVQRWQHAEKAWRANRHDKDVREAPFVLVGSVLQSVPPDIGLQRLHVSRTMEQDLESLSLVLEGSYEGAEASPEFREWVHSLQYLRILGRVENLRFERKDGSIHFHLTGQTGHGGWR